MELVNTHCHCVYSGHGVGSLAEYADAAAAAGLTTLAFTEHFPLSAAFDPDRYLSMTEENLPRYLAEIEQARAAHPSVEFIVGTEMDYLGDLEDRALDEAALAPFAGQYAQALFAIGLVAASFLAACVLPLTTAFVICEAFGWEAGVSFKWREAPTFKSIFTFVIAFSAIVVLLPDVNLLAMMLTAQFVNGVILPILLAFMAIISADKRIMGAYRSRRVSKVLLWATVGVVAILTAVLLAMQVMCLA